MATVDKTWVFASDNEGLADVGDSAISVLHDTAGSGGAGTGSIEFTGAAGATQERARRASTGETWETWGVPAGSTVTSVQVISWNSRKWSAPNAPIVKFRVVGSGGSTVHSAGDLVDLNLATGADAGWVSQGTGTSRNVDAGSQPSTTDVRLEIQVNHTAASTSHDLGIDTILLRITYTAGGGTNGTVTGVPATVLVDAPVPGVSVDATVTAPAAVVNVDAPTGGSLSVEVGAVTAVVLVDAPVPASVVGGSDATVTAPAATVLVDAPVAAVSGGANVTAPAAVVNVTAPVPASVSGGGDVTVTPPAATVLVDAPVPGVSAGAAVTAPAALVLVDAPAPASVTGTSPGSFLIVQHVKHQQINGAQVLGADARGAQVVTNDRGAQVTPHGLRSAQAATNDRGAQVAAHAARAATVAANDRGAQVLVPDRDAG